MLRTGRRSRPLRADVAQLVAHHLAKVRVAGSNPVIRSKVQSHQFQRWSGRVVRQRPAKPCTRVRFPSPPPACLIPGAISSAGERFPDTEEVTGSIPVSRTIVRAVQRLYPNASIDATADMLLRDAALAEVKQLMARCVPKVRPAPSCSRSWQSCAARSNGATRNSGRRQRLRRAKRQRSNANT